MDEGVNEGRAAALTYRGGSVALFHGTDAASVGCAWSNCSRWSRSRIRSVLWRVTAASRRMAVMLRNIHFGGDLSGICSKAFSICSNAFLCQSKPCAMVRTRMASTANPIKAPAITRGFFFILQIVCAQAATRTEPDIL
jgi:hypothetical protein